MARLEFLGGLWLCREEPCIPSYVLETALVEAARKNKLGKQAAAGVMVMEDAPLHYKGPRKPEELWKDERFRLVASARVKQARVMRTRPKFDNWSAEITIQYLPEMFNESQIEDMVKICGQLVGIGDWRSRYGAFLAEKL